MDEFFKEMAQKIKVYLSVESVSDPYEKNVELTTLPSLPILAVVNDLSFSKIQWAMPAIFTDSAKEIYIHKRHETLIEQSYKIEIKNVLYDSWRINGRMQKKQEGDYIRIFIYHKKES